MIPYFIATCSLGTINSCQYQVEQLQVQSEVALDLIVLVFAQ